jgi:hypothetical protein
MDYAKSKSYFKIMSMGKGKFSLKDMNENPVDILPNQELGPYAEAYFMRSGTEDVAYSPGTDTIFTIEDNGFPVDYKGDVFINKIDSMNQINGRKFRVNTVSDAVDNKRQITLYDYKASPMEQVEDNDPSDDNILVPVDTSDSAHLNSASVKGNMMVSFDYVEKLEHLEGLTVDILANGVEQEPQVVQKYDDPNPFVGIKLKKSALYCSVGLHYQARARTLPLSGGCMSGTSLGQRGPQKAIILHVHYSVGGKIGDSYNRMGDIDYRMTQGFDNIGKLKTGLILQTVLGRAK